MDTELHEELAHMGVAHWWYRGRRTVLRTVLDTHLPARPDRSILEVGAGTGSVTMLLVDYGTVTGVEPHDPRSTAVVGAGPPCSGRRRTTGTLAPLSSASTSSARRCDRAPWTTWVRPGDARPLVSVVARWSRCRRSICWGKHDVVNGHFRRHDRPRSSSASARRGSPSTTPRTSTILFRSWRGAGGGACCR
jgi:hypothetical protein